ncbi:hypothetical protein F4821DRAFT_226573 [Hypoxylon rubiginosum]|uniref:Uncharacterized protein n=1 Tax=Hypoxylon rubiginosum TaxID=110542 RepID=A0ACC0DFM5_9PEZI|nr:hypothetical protein F4821DRAFT_226573 [Hypoxylon rubiginosum]
MNAMTPDRRSPPPPYSAVNRISRVPAREPPSYATATAVPATTMNNPTSSAVAPRATRAPSYFVEIPRAVTAYWPKRNLSSEFCLGESPDKLLFRVSKGPHFAPHPLLALYIGPAKNGLALGKLHKPDVRNPHDDGLIEIFSPASAKRTVVHMTSEVHIAHTYRPFTMVVGEGGREHAETFEWRRSRGSEVHTIDKDKVARGYKLVRLSGEAPTGGHGGKRKERPIGESSDGKEVVAVWVTNDNKRDPERPDRKPFQFQLCGSGLTGTLGKHFAFVALMTALKIWITEGPLNAIPVLPDYDWSRT